MTPRDPTLNDVLRALALVLEARRFRYTYDPLLTPLALLLIDAVAREALRPSRPRRRRGRPSALEKLRERHRRGEL